MTEKKKAEKRRLVCPYCDDEIAEESFPYCQACEVDVFHCPRCREPLSRYDEICPKCGANIRSEALKED